MSSYYDPSNSSQASPGISDTPSTAKNNIGLWAMILGLGGIIFGFLTGIPGAIMGAIGLKNVNNGQASNKGQAMTGLIAGIVTSLGGLIGGIIVVIALLTGGLFASAGGAGGAGGGGSDPAPVPNEPTQGSQDPGSNNQGSDNPGSTDNPGSSNGGSGASQSSGDGSEIGNGIEMKMSTKQVTAGPNAYPDDAQGKPYTMVEITFVNNSSQVYTMQYPYVAITVDGEPAEVVSDVETQPKTIEKLPNSLAPGESASFQTGALIEPADTENMVVSVKLGTKTYELKKS